MTMEKILETLLVCFKKYLVPSLISLAIALLVLPVTPNDFFLLLYWGKPGFFALVFVISLLILLFVRFVYSMIKQHIIESKEKKAKDKREEEERSAKECEEKQRLKAKQEKETKELRKFVDNLSIQEREDIEEFIKTGNAERRLYIIDEENNKLLNSGRLLSTTKRDYGTVQKFYKLDEDFYRELVRVKNSSGHISDFSEDSSDE